MNTLAHTVRPLRKASLLLALAVAVDACASASGSFRTHVVYLDPAARPGAPGLAFPLHTGQLVLSEAPGAHSFLFSLGTETFYPLTHAAIVKVDPATGEAFVYDTAAEYKPRFARKPADALDGGMRKVPFLDYVASNLYAEVQEPPETVDRARMAGRLDQLWARQVPFDPYWDLDEHEALFCTELVADVLVAGGAVAPVPVPVTRNPSLLSVLRWFGVRGDVGLPAAVLLGPGARRVVAFSVWRTDLAVRAYFAAKRELHRRFTVDQKIGNILVLDGMQVRTRPQVQAFLDRSAALFDDRPVGGAAVTDDEVRAAVDALATATLGPFREGV